MKITKELRSLSDAEKQKRLQEFKKDLLKLKSGSGAAGNLAGKLRQTRKNIARIKTLLSQPRGESK